MAQSIQLDLIRTDGGTQPRVALDWKVIDEYQDLYEDGVKLPPVTVYYDGSDYWLADGFHRINAVRAAGKDCIQADVHQGTLEDAQWFSFSANKTHGARRSNEDKQRAVQAALKHPKCVGLSDRQIAKHVGVDHVTVIGWRKKMESGGEIHQQDSRKGSDGKTYKASSNRKSKPAPAPTKPESEYRAEAQERAKTYTPPPPEPEPQETPGESDDLSMFRFHLQSIVETQLTTSLLADEIAASPNATNIRSLMEKVNEFVSEVLRAHRAAPARR